MPHPGFAPRASALATSVSAPWLGLGGGFGVAGRGIISLEYGAKTFNPEARTQAMVARSAPALRE